MTDPDDPRIESRYKFALLIGLDSGATESYLLLTTSQLDKLAPIRRRIPDGFHELSAGDYGWVAKPTLVDLREVRTYSRTELLQKMHDGLLTFECVLKESDLQAVDTKLRLSKTIELRMLRKIVDGVF
jgi:hypothetical protein